MNKVLIKNGLTYREGKFRHEDILIEEGIIKAFGQDLEDQEAKIIPLNGELVSLGFVDIHTHLREPGFSHKGTVKDESLSGLYGGYTHLVAMANTSPCMDDVETVKVLEEMINKDACINVYTYSAITKDLKGQELVDMEALNKLDLVLGFSDDGKGVQNDEMMEQAMRKVKELDSIIVAHCEDEKELKPKGCVHEGLYSQSHGLVGINNASEYNEVKRNIELTRKIGNRLHVCHVSTKESVEFIRQAKKDGLQVTGEVSPHHLLLEDMDIINNDPNFKMNPPLRSHEDRLALIEGLKDGSLSVIATDHAPHSKEEKQKFIADAPFGIIGLQHAFPLIYTYLVKEKIVSLETVLDALTLTPASILRMDHQFKEGYKANLCIFDLNEEFTIEENSLKSKASNYPFIGKTCCGKIKYMFVNGQLKVM